MMAINFDCDALSFSLIRQSESSVIEVQRENDQNFILYYIISYYIYYIILCTKL